MPLQHDFSLESLLEQAAKAAALDTLSDFEGVGDLLTREQSQIVLSAVKEAINAQLESCKRLAVAVDKLVDLSRRYYR